MTKSRRRIAIVLVALTATLGAAVAISLASPTVRPDPGRSALPSASATVAPEEPGDATIRAVRGHTILPGAPTEPAGRQLQSRLWTIDGTWWAAMVEPATRETRIYELSPDGATWTDTGVVLDERPGAMADVLWSGDHLYVASAVPGRSTANGVRVSRFSREPGGRFVLDPNFPVSLTERGVTAVSVARDGSDRLWAAFVQEGRLSVAHSLDDEAVWSPPGSPGDIAGTLGGGDVAALVADGSGRLGLVWTDAPRQAVMFVGRADGDAPDRWSAPETAFEGLPLADESISAAAGGDGTVIVAVETAVPDDPTAGGSDPASVMLARDPAGAWRSALIGRVDDHLGEPIALFDRSAGEVYVFAASPRHGGTIYLKRAGIDRLEFVAGRGVTVIADPSAPDIAFLTSTKQPIDLEAGFVVLGFDEQTGFYWHAVIGPAGGTATPSASPSSATGSPGAVPSPPAPRRVPLFTDNFDPWPVEGPIGNGWEVGPADAPGTLTAVADGSGPGRHAYLLPAGASAVRACKAFPPTAAGTLVAEARVRLDGTGGADAVITSIRDQSGEAVSVRFGQGGTFAYYSGQTKVRSAVPIRTKTWYRSSVTVHMATHTYDWRLAADDGTVLLTVKGATFREAAVTEISELCAQTPAGDPRIALRFDDVRVSR